MKKKKRKGKERKNTFREREERIKKEENERAIVSRKLVKKTNGRVQY